MSFVWDLKFSIASQGDSLLIPMRVKKKGRKEDPSYPSGLDLF